MKIFLDNCVHYGASTLLTGHSVRHAVDMHWEYLANGELIRGVAQEFDVMLTVDKNIRHQQNLSKLQVPVVELNVPDSRFGGIKHLSPYFSQALLLTQQFRFVVIHMMGILKDWHQCRNRIVP